MLVACSNSHGCADMNFSRFRAATRIVVTVDSRDVNLQITSAADIAALASFAESHGDGWGVPWAGTPVARLVANFYDRDKFLGDLGIGPSFLTAQGCGYFQSRHVSPADRDRVLKLIGVPPPDSKNGI
jgi:hypothetical protein